MGLLEDVLGQVMKTQGAGSTGATATAPAGGDQLTAMLGSFLGADKKDASPVILAIMKFVQSQGGISGILAKFQSKGLDKQADGGTHVASTADVGRVVVTGTESKGKGNKRIRLEVTDA